MTVIGTCRVVDLLEQTVKFFLVAQRQTDRQTQTPLTWKTLHRGQTRYDRRHVSVQQLSFLRPGRCGQEKRDCHEKNDRREKNGLNVMPHIIPIADNMSF